MSSAIGVHCAKEIIRLGMPTPIAIAVLMRELNISKDEAKEAIRVASLENPRVLAYRARGRHAER